MARLLQDMDEKQSHSPGVVGRLTPLPRGPREKIRTNRITQVMDRLRKDGYTHIITEDNHVCTLSDASVSGLRRCLDLRKWSQTQTIKSTIERIQRLNDFRIRQLRGELTSLEQEIDTARYVYSQHPNGWLLDARYRKMEKEVAGMDQRVEKLCAEIEQLRHVEREDKHIVLIIKELQLKIERQEELIETLKFTSHSEDSILTGIFAAHVRVLEKRLKDREQELEMLGIMLAKEKSLHQNSVNELEGTKHKSSGNRSQEKLARPPVQKSTSFSATTESPNKPAVSLLTSDRKTATTSDRGLTSTVLNENQQSWLKLLQKLLVPVSLPVPSWLDTTHKSSTNTNAASDQSLSSERKLPDVNSAPSLASTEHSVHSSHTTESIREFILHLFDSDTTLNKASSPKIPSAPCNSAASVSGKPCKDAKPRSLSSGELREALRRLFCISDDDLKKVLPGASDDSITSLGSAMRNLFFEELSPVTKPEGLYQ